jgi:hypothetical protein
MALSRDNMELLFQSIAEHIDKQPPQTRTRFMCKAFLLLAESAGQVDAALGALEEAAKTSNVPGRAEAS